MKKWKVLAVLTLLSLSLFVLAACGEDTGNGAPAIDEAPLSIAADPPAANGAETPAGLDLGGRTITIGAWWAHYDHLIGPNPTEPDPATATNYAQERMQWDNIRRIEAEYNVNLTNVVISWGETMPTLTSSVMAGNPMSDLQWLFGHMTLAALVGNLILPASAYATPNCDIFTRQRFIAQGATFDGEVWNMVHAEMPQGQALGVNLDVIRAIGAENPVDLHNRGEWTWEAWREIMRLATRDTDGDGLIDQWGFASSMTDMLLTLTAANDAPMIDEATRTYALDHPHTMRTFDFIFDMLVTDRTHDPDFTDWRAHPSAFFHLGSLHIGDPIEFDFAIVPYPYGPDNHRGYRFHQGFPQGVAIPVGVANPHDVYRIYEAILGWAGDDYWMMAEGTLDWARTVFQTEEDVQRWFEIGHHPRRDLARTVNEYYWMAGWFVAYFLSGEHSVATAVEAMRPHGQNLLDAVFVGH